MKKGMILFLCVVLFGVIFLSLVSAKHAWWHFWGEEPELQPVSPSLLSSADVFERQFAFRLPAITGYSSGVIAFDPNKPDEFWMVVNDGSNPGPDDEIVKFRMPSTTSNSNNIDDLPYATLIQGPLDIWPKLTSNPNNNNQISSLLAVKNPQDLTKTILIFGAYQFYDQTFITEAEKDAQRYVMGVIDNPDDLINSPVRGFFALEGARERDLSSGYLSLVQPEYQSVFGGDIMLGSEGGSVTLAPGLKPEGLQAYVFNLADLIGGLNPIPTRTLIDYPSGYTLYDPAGTDGQYNRYLQNTRYGYISGQRVGFIVPGTGTVAFIGHSGGFTAPSPNNNPPSCYEYCPENSLGYHESNACWPIIYKGCQINPLNGQLVPQGAGPGSTTGDYTPYVWYYKVEDFEKVVSGQSNPWDVLPYSWGKFSQTQLPNDYSLPTNFDFFVRRTGGASYDSVNNILYLSFQAADRPAFTERPLIVAFKINTAPPVCGNGIIEGSEGCDDSNTANGDGCSSTCIVEQGWRCTGQPSSCVGCVDSDGDGWNAVAGGTCGAVADCDDNNVAINPGATEICNDGIDNNCNNLIDSFDNACLPPTITITSPTNEQILSSSSITVRYFENGNLAGVDHVHLQLDSEAEIRDLDNDGIYVFNNVADGAHSVRAYMADASHVQIGNAVSVSFSVNTAGGCLISDPALQLYMNFDDGTASDLSGKGNNGDVTGATAIANGKYGGAFNFDGVNDYITISDGDNLDFEIATEDFSVFAWVRTTNAVDGDVIFQKMDALGDGWRLIFLSSGVVRASLNGISRDSLVNVNNGQWRHVGAVAKRDGNLQVYIDGVASGGGVSIAGQTMDIALQSSRIGAASYEPTFTLFNGDIDEAVIFSKALTASEVSELYNGNYCSNPICGNGLIESGEVCDDGALNGQLGKCNTQCNGIVPLCVDNDGDGYGSECALGNDCDDANANINPGASEVCGDGIDNNCASGIDEGCAVQTAFCDPLPLAAGNIITVSSGQDLPGIVSGAASGTTILLQDGTYTLTSALVFNTPGVSLRSASGNRDAVIIDANYATSGGVSEIVRVYVNDITIADVTIKRAWDHLIHVNGGQNVLIYNVKLIDARTHFIKVNPGATNNDFGTVACSYMEMTNTGRTFLENNPVPGYLCYTGGLDVHQGVGWTVRDNLVKGFYCTNGGLAEFGIHFWNGGSNNLVERNILIDNARGIGFGLLGGGTSGGAIRNNFVYADIPYYNAGIGIEDSPNSLVYHNTVYSTQGEFNAPIDLRGTLTDSTTNVRNNLHEPDIVIRNGATPTMSNNVRTSAGMFMNLGAGDLHLVSTASGAINQGVDVGVLQDIDGNTRDAQPDVGADEFVVGGAVCGNGAIEGSEGCDDGNTMGGDGCSAVCAVESGWTCTGEPSLCSRLSCVLTNAYWSKTDAVQDENVNLILEGTNCDGKAVDFAVYEDDSPFNDDDNAVINPVGVSFFGGTATALWKAEWQCDGNVGGLCTFGNPEYYFVALLSEDNTNGITSKGQTNGLLRTTASSSVCGNGIPETGEDCDDGNSVDGDGCSAVCAVESGWTCTGEPSSCNQGFGRLQPSDLIYQGAFRFPAPAGTDQWNYGADSITYYPLGDSAGGDDGYIGSIFGTSHRTQSKKVGEITIPVPVNTRDYNSLPVATTLQSFADIKDGVTTPPRLDLFGGLAYIPAQGVQSKDLLYWAWYQYYYVSGCGIDDDPSFGISELDLSLGNDARGVWRLGSYGDCSLNSVRTSRYIFDAPLDWANQYTGGKNIFAGKSTGQGIASQSQGPVIAAFAPVDNINPPAYGASLDAQVLLSYPYPNGENDFPTWTSSDYWTGGAWMRAGSKEGILLVGNQGERGYSCYGEAYSNLHMQNSMTAVKFTMPNEQGTTKSMSVYVKFVDFVPNNQFSLAIYTDNGGAPGTVLASSQPATLQASSWNSVMIPAVTLSPNTAYWLVYNTNGDGLTKSNMKFYAGAADQMQWRAQPFGSWPNTFGAVEGRAAYTAYIYVTYDAGGVDKILGDQSDPADTSKAYCYDICQTSKGYHNWPYKANFLLYDSNELAQVAQGAKQPNEILPYATYTPTGKEFYKSCGSVGGVAFDKQRGILYVVEPSAGPVGSGAPITHVYKIDTSSLPSVCGNGIIESGEVCDSNNLECFENGYRGLQACNVQCNGFGICEIQESCGDNVLNGNEACDDGLLNGQPNKCNSQCTGITSALCGNSIPEAGEDCDDGNELNSDACISCRIANCGDGYQHVGEEACDDGLLNGQPNKCNSQCTGITSALCGNNVVESGEQCDDGNNIDGDSCTNACLDAICGDGVTRIGIEECDDGNLGSLSCSVECKLTRCGDDVVQNPNGFGVSEICELGEEIECSDSFGYKGKAFCSGTCEAYAECVAIEKCGDGMIQSLAGEECDDGNSVGEDGCSVLCKNENPSLPPALNVIAPEAKEYRNVPVPLAFIASNADSCYYVLDGARKDTTCDVNEVLDIKYTLNVLENHRVDVFAVNVNGQTTKSVDFSVYRNRKYVVKYGKFSSKGETTNLDSLEDKDLENTSLTLDDGLNGKIEFNEPVNLTSDANETTNETDIDSNVEIFDKKIGIDTGNLKGLNKKARLTFRNIGFSDPKTQKDGADCSVVDCVEVSYTNGIYVVDVSGFSVYTVVEGQQPPPPADGGSPGGDNGGSDGGGVITPPKDIKKNESGGGVVDIIVINGTGEELERVELSLEETQNVNVGDGTRVVLEVEGSGRGEIVDFSVEGDKVIMRVVSDNKEYEILGNDVVKLLLGDKEVYFGVRDIGQGRAIVTLGLEKESVEKEIGIVKPRWINYMLISIVAMLVFVVAGLMYRYLKFGRD